MKDRCTGHCCKNFSLPLGPKELWNAYNRWVATQGKKLELMSKENTRPGIVFADIHLIAPMVVSLGPKAKIPKYVNPEEKGPDIHRYKCKHWDPKTKDCTIYDARPQMCRDYPGCTGCNYAACTWEPKKRKKTKPAKPGEGLLGGDIKDKQLEEPI